MIGQQAQNNFDLDKNLPAGYIPNILSDSKCSNPEQNNAVPDNANVKTQYFESQGTVTCLPQYHALLKV